MVGLILVDCRAKQGVVVRVLSANLHVVALLCRPPNSGLLQLEGLPFIVHFGVIQVCKEFRIHAARTQAHAQISSAVIVFEALLSFELCFVVFQSLRDTAVLELHPVCILKLVLKLGLVNASENCVVIE